MRTSTDSSTAVVVESPGGHQVSSRTSPASRRSSIVWLFVAVLFNAVAINGLLVLLDHSIPHQERLVLQRHTFDPVVAFFHLTQGNDSLGTMIPALHLLEADRTAPVYETIFFQDHTKFQYPLTSLLPYYALQHLGASDLDLSHLTKALTYACIPVTLLLTLLIGLKSLPGTSPNPPTRRETTLVAVGVGLGGFFFYPLMSGLILGQVQTELTLGFTAALFCWISGLEVASGVIMGLMMLVKPQYGVFLLWALLRKKWSAAAAGLICAGAGTVLSCFVFGVHNNLEYLQVLRFISSTGEGYCNNQSVNGLLNRLLFNGNNLIWEPKNFAPPNSIVQAGTMISSLILFALAVFFPGGEKRRGGVADFACITLVSTMASPVAWTHHYAIVLPILVWLWFSDYSRRRERWATWTFAAAYLLLSNSIPSTVEWASTPIFNVLQSYLYFGAVLLLILLLKSKTWTPEQVPVSM